MTEWWTAHNRKMNCTQQNDELHTTEKWTAHNRKMNCTQQKNELHTTEWWTAHNRKMNCTQQNYKYDLIVITAGIKNLHGARWQSGYDRQLLTMSLIPMARVPPLISFRHLHKGWMFHWSFLLCRYLSGLSLIICRITAIIKVETVIITCITASLMDQAVIMHVDTF
jgi:hypothetical protein